jgi:tripartite-type tricarboxylate transporter receptor subunit TctC
MTFPRLRRALCALTLGALFPLAAGAQAYPAKPVTLVVTVPAGGSIDTTARLMASELSTSLSQPVVVVNRAGAGGNIAADFVAKAEADGYTLLMTSSSTLVINPFIYRTLTFDPVKSFTPVAMPAKINLILVVNRKLQVSTLDQFAALLKAQPGRLNYATSGNGTNPHLAAVLFARETKTQAVHVPYSGIAPAKTAFLAGDVDFMFDSATMISNIRAGDVPALAVIGPERLPALPQVPTFRELGLPGMETARGWYGVLAPAGTPAPIVQRLNHEIAKAMNKPAIRKKIEDMGLQHAEETPDQLAKTIKEDLQGFGTIIKEAHMTLN